MVQRSANAAAAMLLITCGHPLLLSPIASCTSGVQAAMVLVMRASASAAAQKRVLISSAAAAMTATGNKLFDVESAAPNCLLRVGLASRRAAQRVGCAASECVSKLGRSLRHSEHCFGRYPHLARKGDRHPAAFASSTTTVVCAAVCSSAPKCAEVAAAGAKHLCGMLGALGATVHRPLATCTKILHMPCCR
jgi:hypothetical protein